MKTVCSPSLDGSLVAILSWIVKGVGGLLTGIGTHHEYDMALSWQSPPPPPPSPAPKAQTIVETSGRLSKVIQPEGAVSTPGGAGDSGIQNGPLTPGVMPAPDIRQLNQLFAP